MLNLCAKTLALPSVFLCPIVFAIEVEGLVIMTVLLMYHINKLNFEIARIVLGRHYRSFYIFLLESRIHYLLIYQV